MERGYLVTFDVSFDSYRRRLAKLFERYGPKVLRSVYALDLPAARIGRFAATVTETVEPDDHILIVPYCRRCRLRWEGTPLDEVPAGGWVVR
ncbi:CRISPR-associated endonuclease Cas2 [Frankia tisae]|uniref:CRISPR-associated endonuclease Cas2 n=1 Tax=Frankia tisae TaxID=2950104 RepID=UPI0021BFE26C|nr:CRISPR-associated endonuclease Cas2 [Frankia tisae]